MKKYTIANENPDINFLQKCYNDLKIELCIDNYDLDLIFNVIAKKPGFFPDINFSDKESPTIKEYIRRWMSKYKDAISNPPSKRYASPKSSCTDPIISHIVLNATNDLVDTKERAKIGEKVHNLYMSAENVQGNLLEEYISQKIKPYGYLWCAGEILRSIDFCAVDGSLLLQIKNKSITENSSSNKVRVGTDIKKWYRLGTKKVNGMPQPNFRWDVLNELINNNSKCSNSLPKCNMSEEDYKSFITTVANKNPRLITMS